MVAEKTKVKEYLIRAYNSLDKSSSCLAFRYDDSFFSAIEDTVVSRNRNSSISFTVESDFFHLYRWKNSSGMNNAGVKSIIIDKEQFVFLNNYKKKIDDKDKIQSSRLYVVDNTFHFSVVSMENVSYNTEDLDVKFIHKLKNFHVERLLATV